MTNKTFEVKLRLKSGKAEDFKIDNSTLRYGQLFWLVGNISKKIEGPYIVNENTDVHDLKSWLDQEMILIPLLNELKA